MPVQQWREDNIYKTVEEVVTKLFIVNYPAALAVKRDADRIGTVRLEKAFQATLLAVDELSLSFDIKRGSFTKKQLSIDPENSRDGGNAKKAPVANPYRVFHPSCHPLMFQNP